MRKLALALVAMLLAGGSAAANSDECAKFRGFTIGLTPVDDGYLMPLGISSTPRQFLFEFSAAYTKMDEAVAAELKLPTKPLPYGMGVKDSTGSFTTIATAPTLTLGPVTRKNVEVVIGAHRSDWGAGSGATGANIFYGLDMELDLAQSRLGLYLPRENCEFVPFWPAVEWGSGDFMTAPTGGIYMPMFLDNTKLIVTFNTTDERSYMSFESARVLFGIAEDDPRLVRLGHGTSGAALYRFPFKSLSGGHNVTIDDPEIYIRAGEKTCGGIRDIDGWKWREMRNLCFGGGDLRLGIKLLKKLHFYFDTKNKKVYFSLAELPTQK